MKTITMHLVPREDGGFNVHLTDAVRANCCDGRMVMILVNRMGVTCCPMCASKAGK